MTAPTRELLLEVPWRMKVYGHASRRNLSEGAFDESTAFEGRRVHEKIGRNPKIE